MKDFSDGPQVRSPRADGLTEEQLANARAVYEDPTAYAEWRLRMGLSQPIKPRTTFIGDGK